MKRLIIIGEGQTEQAFCNDVLQPHFNTRGIAIENPTIKKSKGGIVAWNTLKKEIEIHLKQNGSAHVTLLIDYYGILEKHQFPLWKESRILTNKVERATFLEEAMSGDVNVGLANRFIPYIQLHEFESLLFSDRKVFDKSFEENEFSDYDYLLETLNQFPNPEDINEGNLTAPSKRLERIIKVYDSKSKVVYGSTLAHDIGLKKIREKCPRFNAWISKLEKI